MNKSNQIIVTELFFYLTFFLIVIYKDCKKIDLVTNGR